MFLRIGVCRGASVEVSCGVSVWALVSRAAIVLFRAERRCTLEGGPWCVVLSRKLFEVGDISESLVRGNANVTVNPMQTARCGVAQAGQGSKQDDIMSVELTDSEPHRYPRRKLILVLDSGWRGTLAGSWDLDARRRVQPGHYPCDSGGQADCSASARKLPRDIVDDRVAEKRWRLFLRKLKVWGSD